MKKQILILVGGLWILGAMILAVYLTPASWWLMKVMRVVLWGIVFSLPGVASLFFGFKKATDIDPMRIQIRKGLPILLGLLLAAPIILFLVFLILMGLGNAGILLK